MLRSLIVLAVLAPATPARAEFWASSMGDLMKTANRIEILDVTAVTETQVGRMLEGTLVTAVRSTSKPGAKVSLALNYLPAPKPGDRVLVVCDYECPRAIGIERAGMFPMIAQQPMDGAMVTPNMVETASLALLAAGKPAPDICVRGIVELLDDVARPGFEIKVRPADGSGRGTISGHKVNASLSGVWFASESSAVAVRLAGNGDVTLLAAHVAKDKDGCYSSAFAPSTPLARTATSLDGALDKLSTPMTIARGKITVAKGAPVSAGSHAITFLVTSDGYLELSSDLAEGRVSHVQHDAGHYGLGFDAKGRGELFFDFPVTMLPGFEHGSALAKVVRDGATAQVSWLRGGKKTPLGAITFAYVREPTTIKQRAK